MRGETIRKAIAAAVVLVGLALLLIAPGAAVTLKGTASDFRARLQQRFSAAETEELTHLGCFEEALSVIPDDASVWIRPVGDPYIEQRLAEIAFPRLHLVREPTDYTVFVNAEDDTDGTVVGEQQCQTVRLTVVRR